MDRRRFLAGGTAALAGALVLPMLGGCTTKAALESWINVIGTQAALIVAKLGNVALSGQITQATDTVVSAIAAWSAGGAASVAIQALNLLASLVAEVPVISIYEPLITVIVGFLDAVLAQIPSGTISAPAVAQARTSLRSVRTPVPVSNYRDFAHKFNAALLAAKITDIKPVKVPLF